MTANTHLHWENPPTCHTCRWYYEWHSSPNLPVTKHCAMQQNPTGAPCALYQPKPIKGQD